MNKFTRQLTMTSTQKFLDNYREEHECCPDCGYDSYVQTLAGGSVSDEATYKDTNRVTCKCGSEHTVHDRVRKS